MKAPYGKTFITAEGQVRVRFPTKGVTGKARYIRLSWSEGGKRQQATAGTMDRSVSNWTSTLIGIWTTKCPLPQTIPLPTAFSPSETAQPLKRD